MAETSPDRFYVRRVTGDLIGPLTRAAIADLAQQGKLDGTEEVSPDRRRWQPIGQLIPEAPAPPQPAQRDEGSPSWGERDLGDGADLELAPVETSFGPSPAAAAGPPPELTAGPDVTSPPGLAAIDLESLAPLELAEESKPVPTAAPAPGEKPGSADPPAPMELGAAAAPPADASAPLTGFENAPIANVEGPSLAGGAASGSAAASPVTATRQRTLTAAKPRAAPPPRRVGKPVVIGAAALAAIAALVVAFLAFDLGDLLVREPAATKVLGATASEIAQDRYPAYQRGATALLDEANARPRSAALRAAAAELLAESVVLHRAERARTSRAEAAVAEIPARPIRSAATAPTLARARTWIALAKGRTREAGRVLEEAGAINDPSPERALLGGWLAIGQRKTSVAVTAFRQGAAQFPGWVAFRYGLGRAQEEGADAAAAAATYKIVLGVSPGHVSAALGLIRTGGYPPEARLALATRLLTEHAGNASPTESAAAYAIIAAADVALGKSADADVALAKAMAKDPTSPEAMVVAGERLLAEGRLHDAVARFSAALPGAPAIAAAVPAHELRFAAAAVLIEGGSRADGLALLDPPPAKGGAGAVDPRASFWRGRAAELQTPPDLAAAARAYQETLAASPRFLPASLQLGALLLKQNRTTEAVAVLKRARAAGAAPASLQVALGQALLTAGDGERARKTFKEALAANPKDPAARLGLASALQAGHDTAGARRELESLLADNPDLPGLRPRLAELLAAAGNRDQALALFATEIQAGKASPPARVEAARLAFQMGRLPQAQSWLEAVVAEAPQTSGALLWLGKVRLARGDVAGALGDLRRALSFENTPELHYEHGRALAAGGSEEKALAEYEQAGAVPAAMVARGRIMLARGDTEHSLPILEVAVKQTPGDAEAWLLLGNTYDRMGAAPKAVAAWRQAAHADPANAEVAYHLGRWEMDQGQAAAAVAHLRQAALHAPTSGRWLPDLYYLLGVAEKAKGSHAGAVAAFKKYLALAPPEAPSRKVVEQQLATLNSPQ